LSQRISAAKGRAAKIRCDSTAGGPRVKARPRALLKQRAGDPRSVGRCQTSSMSGARLGLPLVAGGRIRDEDIALVRERSSIVDIASEQVTLKPAGGGNLKGLCPFHDEKTPSFTVAQARNVYFCHGCGEGGDVINFVQKIDHLTFVE